MMNPPITFFTSSFDALPPGLAEDLYRLRHDTFSTRLNWKVDATNGLEFDCFDQAQTVYMLGIARERLVCAARFLDLQAGTSMIADVFSDYFGGVSLPANARCYDVSRLFIDKVRRDDCGLRGLPVTKMLFISMINYCLRTGYDGMYAVVSRGMYVIFIRSGWKIQVIREGRSEKGEKIYLIYMPASELTRQDIVLKNWNSSFALFPCLDSGGGLSVVA